MIKEFICIECPKGCHLSVTINDNVISEIKGNSCEKGEVYARTEIESPMRILTTSVLALGLELKMIPVRTDKPISKARLFDAMKRVKEIRVDKPVCCGNIIEGNFLDLGVNLVATRECLKD